MSRRYDSQYPAKLDGGTSSSVPTSSQSGNQAVRPVTPNAQSLPHRPRLSVEWTSPAQSASSIESSTKADEVFEHTPSHSSAGSSTATTPDDGESFQFRKTKPPKRPRADPLQPRGRKTQRRPPSTGPPIRKNAIENGSQLLSHLEPPQWQKDCAKLSPAVGKVSSSSSGLATIDGLAESFHGIDLQDDAYLQTAGNRSRSGLAEYREASEGPEELNEPDFVESNDRLRGTADGLTNASSSHVDEDRAREKGPSPDSPLVAVERQNRAQNGSPLWSKTCSEKHRADKGTIQYPLLTTGSCHTSYKDISVSSRDTMPHPACIQDDELEKGKHTESPVSGSICVRQNEDANSTLATGNKPIKGRQAQAKKLQALVKPAPHAEDDPALAAGRETNLPRPGFERFYKDEISHNEIYVDIIEMMRANHKAKPRNRIPTKGKAKAVKTKEGKANYKICSDGKSADDQSNAKQGKGDNDNQAVKQNNGHAGYIYIYSHKDYKGYYKIGFTTGTVLARRNNWAKSCGHDVHVEGIKSKQIDYAKFVESLIHKNLYNQRRKLNCPNVRRLRGHAKAHDEWFQAELPELVHVIDRWQDWMLMMPYDDKVNLKHRWEWRVKRLQKSAKPIDLDELTMPFSREEDFSYRWDCLRGMCLSTEKVLHILIFFLILAVMKGLPYALGLVLILVSFTLAFLVFGPPPSDRGC